MANNAWDELLGGMNQHRWEEKRPAYIASSGLGSALGNAIATDMQRDTPFETLSKGMLKYKRMGALKQARAEGLDPTQGEKYYERMHQLLSEAGDYDGANRAYQRSVTARKEHDDRLKSDAYRPYIDEATELTIERARQDLPSEAEKRKEAANKAAHVRNIELELAKLGKTSGDDLGKVEASTVNAAIETAFSDPESPLMDNLAAGNPLWGKFKDAWKVGDFTPEVVKERQQLQKDSLYTGFHASVMSAAKRLREKYPVMDASTAVAAAVYDAQGYEVWQDRSGQARVRNRADGREYVVEPSGRLRKVAISSDKAVDDAATNPNPKKALQDTLSLVEKIEQGEAVFDAGDIAGGVVGALESVVDHLTGWMRVNTQGGQEGSGPK